MLGPALSSATGGPLVGSPKPAAPLERGPWGRGPGESGSGESGSLGSGWGGRGSMGVPAAGPSLADTSTGAEGGLEPAARQTVQARLFTKAGRLHLRLGGSYLAREDFWISPGLTAELGFHFIEQLGLDLSSTLYFSTLDAAARDLRASQGLLPDAQQPILRVALGPRWSFAYGKLLIEDAGLVVHLDASLLLRLGTMVTDRGVNFGGDVALAVQAQLGERWLVWAELSGWVGYEERESSSVSAGPAGALGVGVQL